MRILSHQVSTNLHELQHRAIASQVFGILAGSQGEVGPLTSGWVPLVVFGSLGAVLFGTMRT